MRANDEIDLAALYGRKLTAEQWNALRQEVLQRAQAARTQALRDVADGIRSTAAELAAAAWSLVGNWWKAHAVRRERKAAIRALAALDDRSLRDIGLGRSEIWSAVYDPERSMARNLAVTRHRVRACKPAMSARCNQPVHKSAA
jgi:uncharacterized protein YjiS (DUF1127 family)